jgi:hypothetical protein
MVELSRALTKTCKVSNRDTFGRHPVEHRVKYLETALRDAMESSLTLERKVTVEDDDSDLNNAQGYPIGQLDSLRPAKNRKPDFVKKPLRYARRRLHYDTSSESDSSTSDTTTKDKGAMVNKKPGCHLDVMPSLSSTAGSSVAGPGASLIMQQIQEPSAFDQLPVTKQGLTGQHPNRAFSFMPGDDSGGYEGTEIGRAMEEWSQNVRRARTLVTGIEYPKKSEAKDKGKGKASDNDGQHATPAYGAAYKTAIEKGSMSSYTQDTESSTLKRESSVSSDTTIKPKLTKADEFDTRSLSNRSSTSNSSSATARYVSPSDDKFTTLAGGISTATAHQVSSDGGASSLITAGINSARAQGAFGPGSIQSGRQSSYSSSGSAKKTMDRKDSSVKGKVELFEKRHGEFSPRDGAFHPVSPTTHTENDGKLPSPAGSFKSILESVERATGIYKGQSK